MRDRLCTHGIGLGYGRVLGEEERDDLHLIIAWKNYILKVNKFGNDNTLEPFLLSLIFANAIFNNERK